MSTSNVDISYLIEFTCKMIDSSYQLSGSAAYQLHQIVAKLWQAILIKNLFENRKRIVFQILEHLPYIDLSLGRGLKDGKLFFS